MSMSTDGTVPGSTVPVRLKHAVIATVWIALLAPVVLLSLGASIGAAATLVQLGLAGELTVPLPTLDEQMQLVVLIAILGLFAVIVWMTVRVTFGPDQVDEGIEAGAETVETAREVADDD